MSASQASSKSAKKNAQQNGSGQSGSQGAAGATANETVEQVQATVSGLGDQVKQQASNQLLSRLETAAGGLDTAAKLLRTAGDQVREQNTGVADSITGLADRVEGWSTSLREQDVDKLLDEARQVAQRQPALFVSGAVALGFLGARLLKSPSNQQGQSSSSSSEETSTPDSSISSTSSSPAGSEFENTNPYPSAEENAALEASIDDAFAGDDVLGVDDPMTAPDLQDPLLDERGFTTGVDVEDR